MARLIVEDGGKPRAFRVNDGRLTVGSGEGVNLRLQARGVAELCGTIEFSAGKARLVPAPDAEPPIIGANLIRTPVDLRHGARIQFGEAIVRIEYEGVAAAPVTRVNKAHPGRRSVSRRGQIHRSGGGLKTVGIVAGVVLGVVLLVFFVIAPLLTGGTGVYFEPGSRLRTARAEFEEGRFDRAVAELDRIPERAELTPAFQASVEELRGMIEAGRESRALAIHNLDGTNYLERRVKDFERRYLQGKPARPKVRVFLQRCREFERQWPEHPELEWIERQRSRFEGIVNLEMPATLEDIEFEIESLTWANPRDYKEAFRRLDEYAASASPADRDMIVALREEKRDERAEWFQDRMEQARYHYEKDEHGKAFEWLRVLVVYTGDAEMSEAAASRLVKFANFAALMRGYDKGRHDDFVELMQHPIVAKAAREKGL